MTRKEPQDEDEDEERRVWKTRRGFLLLPIAASLDRMRTKSLEGLTKYFWGMAYLHLVTVVPGAPEAEPTQGFSCRSYCCWSLFVVCVPPFLGSGYVILLIFLSKWWLD